MSLTDNGFVYTGRLRGYRVGVRGQPARPRHPHHQLHARITPRPAARSNGSGRRLKKWLRARPGRSHPRRAQRPARRSSATSTTTTAPTGRCAEPPPPRPSPPPRRPAPPTDRYPHRCSSPATPSARQSGNLFVAPYKVNVGLRWAGHRMRHHPRRRPHRHLQRRHAGPRIHRRPHPQLPTRRQNHPNLPHPRTQTGTISVSDVPRHKCQRCPETPQKHAPSCRMSS